MHPHFFPYLFLLIIFFFIHVPVWLCDDAHPMYDICSRDFQCGDIKSVRYPFWGNDRPDYCGYPGFEIECIDGSSPEIVIMSERYRILDINQTNPILTIARMDFWNDVCPKKFNTTTLNFTLFDYYDPNVQNLTLYYECPPPGSLFEKGNQFSCEINGTTFPAYFVTESFNFTRVSQNLPTCNISIKVPVLLTALASLEVQIRGSSSVGASSVLQTALRSGFDVEYVAEVSQCKECESSGGQCGYIDFQPICFCDNGPHQTSCPTAGAGNITKVAIAASIAGTSIIAGIVLFYCWRKKFFSNNSMGFWKKKTTNAQKVDAFLKNYESLVSKRYKYSDVKKMTNSFKDKLGQGGYGVVFKGKLLDGRMVAVKVLSESKGNGEEFINEVASISRTSHVNIVTLLGFCVEGPKKALIYEFMPNGSLEKFIYDKRHPQLGWETLSKIAIGIAQGLEYLHRGCNTQILHFDIKPHNILLDQDLCPKISDFGLAKLYPVKESIISVTGARGTIGYIAPEMIFRNCGRVSHKSDVYSYGMMVLEMIGGRKNTDVEVTNISEIYFPHWIYKRLDLGVDLELNGITTIEDEEIARKMILVGLWCIQINPSDRPSMSRVVDMLEGSLEALQIPPNPVLSSPPRSQADSSTVSSTWEGDEADFPKIMLWEGSIKPSMTPAVTDVANCSQYEPRGTFLRGH